jgi:hypothetical protein
LSNIALQPGDILLFEVVPNSPWHDKLIALGEKLLGKQFTKTSYCHVAMIQIKARNNKIQVFRMKNATKKQCLLAVAEAHKDLGLWYNIGKLFFGLFPKKHEVICSTYVAISWKVAGKVFSKIDDKVFSPDEIAADPLVEHVGELIL